MEEAIKRAELGCCHTACASYVSKMDSILTPEEWIDIACGAGIRAIAIADFQDVGGFEDMAQALEKLRREVEPGELDFKVLYGLETMLEDGSLVHLLVQRQEGLVQLYRMLAIAWQGREERPFLLKSEVNEHRTGLLVGCPGKMGEVYRGILKHLDDAHLEEIAGFYDYLAVLPPQHYKRLSTQKHTCETLGAEDLILKTIAIGKRSGKPVAAVGNKRTASQDRDMFRRSVAYGIQKDEGLDLDTLPDILYTEEMLNAFSFLEKELAEEIVIHVPDRLADLCEEIRIFPEGERCL